MTEQDEIEARKKKAERGWIVEPPQPYPDYSPAQEIDRWCAVIPSTRRRGRGSSLGVPEALRRDG